MKRWMMTCAAGVLAMGGVVAVSVIHGCGSAGSANGGMASRNGASERERTPMYTPAPAASVAGEAEVPEMDLNGVLQQSQGGGGSQSPFQPGMQARDYADSASDYAKMQASMAAYRGVHIDSGGAAAPGKPVQNQTALAPGLVNINTAPADVLKLLPTVPADSAPPEFSLHPGQELWVIERPRGDRYARPNPNDDYPGSATLMTRYDDPDRPGSQREVPVPLKHTDVHASIAGAVSSVRVTQQYHNPFSSKIEALYVFPLPDDAAVNDFVMTIGSRSIRGVIREREQAERIYEQARSRGYHASLMTQERSNIFTQKVANIEPGESVDIDITYFHTLGFREGGYEFVFPMVIGPRFNPCGDRNGVGSVPVFASGASGQATEVQYLRPDMRSGADISLSAEVDAGVAIESIESPTHSVIASVDPAMPWRATARLSTGDTIPNRDFVLRYRVSGGQLKGGLITHRDERGGFFSLVLVPPSDLKYTTRGPVELVFVVDCSGSMEGEPLALCKRAVVNALGQLRPEDTFQIVRFSDTCSFMTERPLQAHPDNIRRGFAYVQGLNANGGTMMLKGLEPALEMRGDWNRTRFVCLLSDGLLGNEPEVLEQLKKKLGDSRIFSMGIGAAPNRTLLNAMARIGRGAAGYVATERDADEVTNLFVERISSAAMTDLRIDWGDLDVADVYPKRIPDLYVGRPVVLYGRYRNTNARPTDVRVSGRVGGERQTMTIASRGAGVGEGAACNAPGLPLVWARTRITDLDENAAWGNKDVGAGSVDGPNKREIRDLALKFGLLSAYTSLVAVDSSERTAGTYGTSVPVPVNVPQGVRYDTTVEGGIGARRVGER